MAALSLKYHFLLFNQRARIRSFLKGILFFSPASEQLETFRSEYWYSCKFVCDPQGFVAFLYMIKYKLCKELKKWKYRSYQDFFLSHPSTELLKEQYMYYKNKSTRADQKLKCWRKKSSSKRLYSLNFKDISTLIYRKFSVFTLWLGVCLGQFSGLPIWMIKHTWV